jgi:hypothetical protein
MALVIKKYDLDQYVLASSIRIKNKSDKMGISEDRL